MNIAEATKSYEAWVGKQTPLLPADVRLKHARMREDVFSFLRATYYRWAQIWPEVCPKASRAKKVLSVGDLHVENFGTWRDADGRLVWGVNDFDEVHPLPFTNDLIRLAVSAHLAIGEGSIEARAKSASATILDGYRRSLEMGGKPLVLVDKRTPLRVMARHRLDEPERFWQKFESLPTVKQPTPKEVDRVIRKWLPDARMKVRFVHRVAGLGSLGKQRHTALGAWSGGSIVREAKALSASACVWAEGGGAVGPIRYPEILKRSVRSRDPWVSVEGRWLVRRLSPDCFRIELGDLPAERDEMELLWAMGWETANIHLGSGQGAAILKTLKQAPDGWLQKGAKKMTAAVMSDWKEWRKR